MPIDMLILGPDASALMPVCHVTDPERPSQCWFSIDHRHCNWLGTWLITLIFKRCLSDHPLMLENMLTVLCHMTSLSWTLDITNDGVLPWFSALYQFFSFPHTCGGHCSTSKMVMQDSQFGILWLRDFSYGEGISMFFSYHLICFINIDIGAYWIDHRHASDQS